MVVEVVKMRRDLDSVIELLKGATSDFPSEYFQLPVAGQEDDIYRERVYCYELYHRMKKDWPTSLNYSLAGEVDKSGHPLIRGGSLDRAKPDFIFHRPGEMRSNLLVMEVKPINLTQDNLKSDLQKLSAFRSKAQYFAAFMLFYGWESLPNLIRKIKEAADQDTDGIKIALLRFWHHADPLSPAIEIEVD